jgi:hypothetical protein
VNFIDPSYLQILMKQFSVDGVTEQTFEVLSDRFLLSAISLDHSMYVSCMITDLALLLASFTCSCSPKASEIICSHTGPL